MASDISLSDLVDAIANAVIEAQDRVEHHQVALLQNYLDDNNRPLTLTLRVPSMRDFAGEFAEDELEAPLLALVGMSRLAIKELEISTKVGIGGLHRLGKTDGPGADSPSLHAGRSSGSHSILQLDLGAPTDSPAQATARMTVKVGAQEPSEGIARLMVELNKRIRTYPVPEA